MTVLSAVLAALIRVPFVVELQVDVTHARVDVLVVRLDLPATNQNAPCLRQFTHGSCAVTLVVIRLNLLLSQL